MNSVSQAIESRRSTRAFTKEPVSKEQIFASNQNANHEDGEVMLKNFLDLDDRIKIFVYWISENILILV